MSKATGEMMKIESEDRGRTLLKSIVTAAVIGFGVVSFWRGVWYLWDVLVFTHPDDKLYSAVASMATGILILGVMRTFYSVLAPPIERVNIRSRKQEER